MNSLITWNLYRVKDVYPDRKDESTWELRGSCGGEFYQLRFNDKPSWSDLDPIMIKQNEIWQRRTSEEKEHA